MSGIKHESIDNIPKSHKNEHEGYECYRRKFVPSGGAKNTLVSVCELRMVNVRWAQEIFCSFLPVQTEHTS